jgi:hypothetical protein
MGLGERREFNKLAMFPNLSGNITGARASCAKRKAEGFGGGIDPRQAVGKYLNRLPRQLATFPATRASHHVTVG